MAGRHADMVCRPVLAAASVCLLALAAPRPAAGLVQYQRLEEMHHTAWSAKDGLVGQPTSLAQTTDGYLWIGTSNGLFRFDGIQFEQYHPERGTLAAVAVSALFAAPDGGLWIAHSRGGVSFIAPDGTATGYAMADGLPIGKVRSIVQDHDGAVWIAAIGGLARFEAGRWHAVRMDWNYPCLSAWKLFVERDGTLWVGAASPDRILFLPKGTRKFIDIHAGASAIGFAQVGDSTIAYAHLHEPTIHLVRRGPAGATEFQVIVNPPPRHSRQDVGAPHRRRPAGTRLLEQHVPSPALVLDAHGGLWSAGHDITRLRLSDNPAEPGRLGLGQLERVSSQAGLTGAFSNDLLIDREGTVWVTTEGGLDRFRRRNLTWRRDSLVERGASLVTDKDGEVWLFSYHQPAIRRARDGAPVAGGPALVDNGYVDRQGAIWLSTLTELLRWQGGRFTRIPPPKEVVDSGYDFVVVASTEDQSGRLWASVNGSGVFYWVDRTWTFVPILPGRPDWTPIAAHTDADGRVWLAYRDELAMVRGSEVRIFSRGDGLDVGALQAVRARGRQIWVGGELGLAFLRGERFHPVEAADGREFGSVSGIVPTHDGIWLSAASGIVHVPASEIQKLLAEPTHRVQYQALDIDSDLPDPLVFANSSRGILPATEGGDGVLWFLTGHGLAMVNPKQIVRNPLAPPVVIRAVIADDQAYPTRGSVSLPPLTRTLQIGYTSLSLVMPERGRFRYRLEGWDDEWHDPGTRREVFYTNLKPGRYTFRVLASNNDGIWNESGATLRFTVAPAWFQTMWFQAMVALALLASIVLAYRIRVRRISAALSARFDERLAERTRIARELHDTLLQTVQGSKMVADDALASDEADRLRRAMERLAGWLGQAVEEGRGAVRALRGSAVTVNDLAESLRVAADNPAKPPALVVSVDIRGTPRDIHPIVRDEIYRIGYEAIRNACAHSGATRLAIAVEYAHDLTLRITDNGVGIDPAVAESGKPGRFGLSGMRERAANIGATLTITGAPTGSCITLVVPGRSVFRARPSAQHSRQL